MKRRRPLLGLLLVALCLNNCTVQRPVANNIRKTHHEAVWVTPSWNTKRSVWGAIWPFAVGSMIGAAYGAGVFGNQAPIVNGRPASRGEGAAIGAGVGIVFPGFVLAPARQKRFVQRPYNPTQADEWVRAYPGDWVLLTQQGHDVQMVPRSLLTAYQHEERAIAERAERARREAEERAELVAYNKVLDGTIDAYLVYTDTYPTGKHITEVRALQQEALAYYDAMRGTIKECEIFLQEWAAARLTFRTKVMARKGNLEEARLEADRKAELARRKAKERLIEAKSWVRGDNICMETDGTSTNTVNVWLWSNTTETKARYRFRAFVEDFNEDHSRFKIRIADMFRNGDDEIGKFQFSGTTVWRTNDVVWIDPSEWDFARCR